MNQIHREFATSSHRDSCYAAKCNEGREFMEELVALCKKHGLAIVPTHENQVSFHDSLRVVPLEDGDLEFIKDTEIIIDLAP
jgi:hypothetical protein